MDDPKRAELGYLMGTLATREYVSSSANVLVGQDVLSPLILMKVMNEGYRRVSLWSMGNFMLNEGFYNRFNVFSLYLLYI